MTVLPASAGMIPKHPHSQQKNHSAPRIRGDDPTPRVGLIHSGEVLPASAGMILWLHMTSLAVLCAPRIRGDDPQYPSLIAAKPVCSPHPRG